MMDKIFNDFKKINNKYDFFEKIIINNDLILIFVLFQSLDEIEQNLKLSKNTDEYFDLIKKIKEAFLQKNDENIKNYLEKIKILRKDIEKCQE